MDGASNKLASSSRLTDPVLLLANDAQVPALTDSATVTEAAAALPEEISHALAELRGAGGLSPRSKRLLAAALELSPAATAAARRLRMRRAGFWGKGARGATLVAVAAADVALAAYLYARRANEWYGHAPLPPT
ncbi:uncharacterized protein [Miscanthus floridulus]|uniref:uncharacterized protein n=1 Tax=Miscanthus floridulus TaxID=154761 RepID=UPI003458AF55